MTISRQHNPKDGFDMFIYEGHLGKLFVSEKQIPEENLFCKVCGDFDWEIGEANNRKEAWKLLKNDVEVNGSGGYDKKYIQNFINEHWNV